MTLAISRHVRNVYEMTKLSLGMFTHNPLLQVPDLLLGELDGLPHRGEHLRGRRGRLLDGRGGCGCGLDSRLLLGGGGRCRSRRLPRGLVGGVGGRHDGERGHDPCRSRRGEEEGQQVQRNLISANKNASGGLVGKQQNEAESRRRGMGDAESQGANY